MTFVVHKQVVAAAADRLVRLPMGAEILCAREQRDAICIWYRFDVDTVLTQERQIVMCGTGHPAPSPADAHYIGTVFLHGGDLVLHVFERLHLVRKS